MKKLADILYEDLLLDRIDLGLKLAFDCTLESAGVYSGQSKLANKITQDIVKNKFKEQEYVYTLEDLQEFENIFFDKLVIRYFDVPDNSYQNNDSNYDKYTGRFKSVVIDISSENNTYKQICDTISHELLHNYQDNKMFKNGKKLLDLKSNYKELDITENDDSLTQACKQLSYDLADFEINAFLSEISLSLENLPDEELIKLKNKNDVLKHFKSNNNYKIYLSDLDFAIKLYKNINNVHTKYFCSLFRKINPEHSKLSDTQLLKYIIVKLEKIIKKIEFNIGKIYYKHYVKAFNKINEGYCSRSMSREALNIETIILNLINYEET